MLMTADLNELAYTELTLSFGDKTSSGKVAFNLVKACKNKDYVDDNAFMAWERLKNKFEPVSAPSLVKMEKNNFVNVFLRRIKTLRLGSLN